MHNDQILHYLSLIKAPKAEFSADDSMFLGSIPSLLMNYYIDRPELFAQKFFELIEAYPPYAHVSRLCIARRLGLANNLFVISSHQTNGVPNTLNPGYSCFVRPDSSLLKLKSTEIRIFDDARNVVRTFIERGEPPQRSIFRIAAAGFQSGVCLPLFQGSRNFGYLFINSQDDKLSKLNPIDYCLLSYMQSITMLAHLHLKHLSDNYYVLAEELAEDYQGDFLSQKALFSSIHRHQKSTGQSIELVSEGFPAGTLLFSPGNLANIISRYAWALDAKKLSISIQESSPSRLTLRLRHLDSIAPADRIMYVKVILADCEALAIAVDHVDTSTLTLSFPRDLAQHPYPYSVDI